MKNGDRPQMRVLEEGQYLKLIEVTAKSGMFMPEHHATAETVIMVKKGRAVLNMDDRDYNLKAGDSMILPAMKDHHLKVIDDFNAVITMALKGDIKFN